MDDELQMAGLGVLIWGAGLAALVVALLALGFML